MPASRSSWAARLELVGAPRGDRDAVAVLAQRPRDREADSARAAGDECRACCQGRRPYPLTCCRVIRTGAVDPCRHRARHRRLRRRLRRRGRRQAAAAREPRGLPQGGRPHARPARGRSWAARGPVLAPSVSQFQPGENRFGFGLFDRSRAQIADAPAAVYIAPVGGGKAKRAVRGPLRVARGEGPVPEPLGVLGPGGREVAVRGRRPRSTSPAATTCSAWCGSTAAWSRPATPAGPSTVLASSRVPDVGDRAPKVNTTDQGPGGRRHREHRHPPAALVDARGQLRRRGRQEARRSCSSPHRRCARAASAARWWTSPSRSRPSAAARPSSSTRRSSWTTTSTRASGPRCCRWRLPTEPWVFTVDRNGRVAARLEGAFSAKELDQAVDAAVKKG